MNIKDIQDELEKTLKVKVSQAALGKALGLSKQRINQIYNNEISDEQYKKILKYFNIDEFSEVDEKSSKLLNIVVKNIVNSYGILFKNKTPMYQISTKLAQDLGVDTQKSEIVFAKGDSMLPVIADGDTLLVDTSRKEIFDGKIYCIRIDGILNIKRLQLIPFGKINIVSDNPKYKSYEMNMDSDNIEIVGEVVWKSTVLI